MNSADLAPRGGHALQLLEGSRQLFPALIQAIDAAQFEVRLETYIFDFTGTAVDVAHALLRAAQRGVAVYVMVDGYGSRSLPAVWRTQFDQAGVQWHMYRPSGLLGMLIPGRWRRLHRKLCHVDGSVAFCGGINVLDDFHDPNHGVLEFPRFDFAVRIQGPVVADVHFEMARLWWRMQGIRQLKQRRLGAALDSLRTALDLKHNASLPTPTSWFKASLVLRDNVRHRRSIERAYRKAISSARHEIIIANAYFVPGRKLRHALILAAERGVKVRLLLQGRYEYFMQYYAARSVYGALLRAGAEIHEYSPSFLHAKVAVVDGHWATIGSSNLDPLSLLLTREANVVVDDAGFAQQLRERLLQAIQTEGVQLNAQAYEKRSWLMRCKEIMALGLMRLALLVHRKEY